MDYYNEIDDYAATWIENLILDGLIPDGRVDRRSIVEVTAADLSGYRQCHFFAGIAGWALALKLAGWPEGRRVWTGSCPCQPFSQAGKGEGLEDERHLWPHFARLIRECRPPEVFGEQVASKDAEPWLDVVLADLEGLDYAGAAVAFPSASVGAPHIRDRTYWVGHANDARLEGFGSGHRAAQGQRQGPVRSVAEASGVVGVADDDGFGLESPAGEGLQADAKRNAQPRRGALGVGNADGNAAGRDRGAIRGEEAREGGRGRGDDAQSPGAVVVPGPTNGFWRDVDWLFGRDAKWRPVEPGTFPLVDAFPGRMEQLRAYGNAINPEQAAEFVRAYMECRP